MEIFKCWFFLVSSERYPFELEWVFCRKEAKKAWKGVSLCLFSIVWRAFENIEGQGACRRSLLVHGGLCSG